MAGQNFRTPVRALAGFVADEYFIAATDLSGSGQFRFVSAGSVSGEVVLATGASNPVPLGVLQNAPTAGLPARVRMFGKSTVTACPAACILIPGTLISSASLGTACATGLLGISLGRWLSASLSGSSTTGEAFINCVGFTACPGAAS